jgi:hypothetical protein
MKNKRKDEDRHWTIRQLTSTYDREKIYEEIWSEPIQPVLRIHISIVENKLPVSIGKTDT